MTIEEQNAMNQAVADAAKGVPEALKLFKDYKAGGLAGLAADIPEVTAYGRALIADAQATLPIIKAGWKTSEFWLLLGFGLVNAGWLIWKGTPLPFDTNSVLAGLLAVYTAARTFHKT